MAHTSHPLPAGVETGSTTSPVVQGNKPTVEQMDAAAAGAVGALGAGWAELRDALAQFVPENAICLNRKFSSIEQHTEYVTLHFTDGTSVRARLVIGADGSFSKVRQQTVADGPPIFSVSSPYLCAACVQGLIMSKLCPCLSPMLFTAPFTASLLILPVQYKQLLSLCCLVVPRSLLCALQL